MSIKVLVTGANGQLAQSLKLVNKDRNISCAYFSKSELDITNSESVVKKLQEEKCKYLINTAAYTNVDGAESEKEEALNVNKEGVRILAEACGNFKVKMLHISTDYVFNGQSSLAYKENSDTDPVNFYGQTKLEGEQEILKILPLNGIIIRTSWLYAPVGHNFLKTMVRLGNEKENISVVNDQHGSPTSALDLARAILSIINHCEVNMEFPAGVYHYSNEGKTTWFDFAQQIMSMANLKCTVAPIPTSEFLTEAIRPLYSLLDSTKIKETFNIGTPKWEDALKECINKL